jgi:hypothetical protein
MNHIKHADRIILKPACRVVCRCGYWVICMAEGLGSTAWVLPQTELDQTVLMQYLNCLEWSIQTTFAFTVTVPSERPYEGFFTIVCIIAGKGV